MRAILPAGLWAVLILSGVRPLVAQTDPNAARQITINKLWAVFHAYGKELHFKFYSVKDPFTIQAFYDKDLRYTPRFEIYISVTRQQTIQFRIYPEYYGNYIDLDSASKPDSLMERVLRFSDKSFFFWAADENMDVFAGYTFTLESGASHSWTAPSASWRP